MVICFVDSSEVMHFTKVARVATDLNGKFIKLIGINQIANKIELVLKNKEYQVTLNPNESWGISPSGEMLCFSRHDYYKPEK